MTITVNSKQLEQSENTTVAELISSLGKNPKRCVVELNGKAMPFSRFSNIALKDGDKIEVMQIVAGG